MFTSTAYALALVVVTVVLSVHSAETNQIKCYVCNSHTDNACAHDKLPDSFKTVCETLNDKEPVENHKNYTLCRKTIQTIEPEVNGLKSDKNRIIRSCGWYSSNYNNKCYHRSGYGGKQDVCTCSTDYCNSAQKTYIAFATMMTLSLAVLIL